MPPSEPEIPGTHAKADRIAYLIIIIIITALFIPVWSRGLTTLLPGYEDQTQWYLYRLFINQVFSSGCFPLWCPHLYAGMNFAGWAHASAFYPAGIIFYILKYVSAVPVSQWLHLLIGTIGLYHLGRVIMIRPLAACLGALWFGLGHLVPAFQENFLPLVSALAWCPWIYAFLYQLIRTQRMRFLLLAAAFMGLEWLSGHIEVIVLQYEVIGICFIALLLSRYRQRPGVILLAGIPVIIGVALGLLAFLPSLEASTRSFRSIGLAYSFFELLAQPQLWFGKGLLWLSVANIITVIALALALIRIKTDRRVMLIACLIFASLTINFNWFDILRIVYQIPLLNRFIHHGLMLHQAFILTALLAGIGLDHLRDKIAKPRTTGIISIALLLEAAAAVVILHVFHLQDKVQTDPAARDLLMNFFQARLYAGCALGGIAIILIALSLRGLSQKTGTIIISLIIAIEFIPAAFAHIPDRPKSILDYNPEYTRFFGDQKGPDRSLVVYPFDSYHELDIPLQSGVLYGTEGIDAYITLSTLRYTRFMSLLDTRSFRLENNKVADIQTPNILKRGDFIGPETIPFINLLNLKYIVSQNKNIKAATHYFLAYEMERFHPVEGGVKKSGKKNIEISPPARFGFNLYFHPGDRLRLGLESPRGSRPGRIIIEVAELAEQDRKKVIFEKMIEAAPGANYPGMDIPLDVVREKRTTICISARAPEKGGPDRLVLTQPHIYNPKKHFTRLDTRDIDIYLNPTAMRRAFLVHDFRVIPDKKARIEFMKGKEFMPDRIAVLESDPGMERPAEKGPGKMIPGEAVKINKYKPDEVHIMVRAMRPGLLVLTDQYEPGWQVWVGGEEKQILPADETFRAVKVDAGHNLIQFKYRPKSFAISLYFSIVSWLSVFVLIAVKRCRAKNRST